MRINQAKGLVARMLLVVSLLLGVVVLTGPEVQAQGRYWRRHDGFRGRVFLFPRVYTYPYYRSYYYNPYESYYYFPSTHVTQDQGYSDGLHDGEDDAEEGKSYNPQRHNDYKNAQTSAYINGYLQGYEEGYR